MNGHLVRVEEAQDMMVEEDGVPVPFSAYIVLYLWHRLLVGKSTVQNFPLYTRGRHYLLAYIKASIASMPATRYDNTNGNHYKECALNASLIATHLRHIFSTTTTNLVGVRFMEKGGCHRSAHSTAALTLIALT